MGSRICHSSIAVAVFSGETLLVSSPEKGGQPRPDNFNAGHYVFICKRPE